MISCVKCHSISTIFLWYKLECLYFMGIYDKWSNFTYLISFKPVFSIGILCLFKITRPPLPSHNAMQFFREVVPQWRIYFIKIRKLIKTHIFIKICNNQMHKSGNKNGTSNISTFYWQSVHAEKSDKIRISDIFGKYQ